MLSQFTGAVLDSVDNLPQEPAVIMLGSGSAPSLDALEEDRTQCCVWHQRETQQDVRKDSPKSLNASFGRSVCVFSSRRCKRHVWFLLCALCLLLRHRGLEMHQCALLYTLPVAMSSLKGGPGRRRLRLRFEKADGFFNVRPCDITVITKRAILADVLITSVTIVTQNKQERGSGIYFSLHVSPFSCRFLHFLLSS